MKMIIKSLVAVGVLAISSGAFAASQQKCGGSGGEASITADASGAFIVNAFTMKCSANVYLAYDEDATKVAVCAGSKKGSKSFGGTSEGGAVKEAADISNITSISAVLATGC